MNNDTQQVKGSPRDVFIYLLATGALYFSAGSIISLLLDYVNILFPDPLQQYFDPRSSIRWPLSMLVVVFPVYIWANRFIGRDIGANSEKAEIRVRRWLIYLTIFLSAILIIGDLVALIYSFLQGDLTVQFILKVLAVLAVAGAIFWYYLLDLRTKGTRLSGGARNIAFGLLAVVGVIGVTGFVLAGSPFRQRLVRFDSQKVSDLQSIQYQVVNYWQRKGVLPPSIDNLRDDIAGYVPPMDPQSGEAYKYRVTGVMSFELCATFNVVSEGIGGAKVLPRMPEGKIGESWDHGTGEHCFPRTIDPEFYPPFEKPPR